MLKNLANVVTFQAGWFTCVLGAATDHGWAGPLACIIYLASHLWHLPDPARYLRFCTVVGFLGLAIDSTLGAFGISCACGCVRVLVALVVVALALRAEVALLVFLAGAVVALVLLAEGLFLLGLRSWLFFLGLWLRWFFLRKRVLRRLRYWFWLRWFSCWFCNRGLLTSIQLALVP
ncbi:MAG: DUF2878 family protein [Nitrospira sp.]